MPSTRPAADLEQDARRAGNVAGIEERGANARRNVGRHAILHHVRMPQHGRDLVADALGAKRHFQSRGLAAEAVEQLLCRACCLFDALGGDFPAPFAIAPVDVERLAIVLRPGATFLRPGPVAHGRAVAAHQHAECRHGQRGGGLGHVDRPGESAIHQQRQPAQVIGMGVGEEHGGGGLYAGGQGLRGDFVFVLLRDGLAGRLTGAVLLEHRAAVDHPAAVARIEHVERAGDLARRAVRGGRQFRRRRGQPPAAVPQQSRAATQPRIVGLCRCDARLSPRKSGLAASRTRW